MRRATLEKKAHDPNYVMTRKELALLAKYRAEDELNDMTVRTHNTHVKRHKRLRRPHDGKEEAGRSSLPVQGK